MGRAFNEKDKEQIKQRLLDAGKELFSQYGLKKTSVEEITKKAGISKGAFYSFYRMKELLLWDIFNIFEETYRTNVMQMFKQGPLTRKILTEFLYQMYIIVEEEPLFKKFLSGSEYTELLRVLPDETIAEHLEDDSDFSIGLIQGLKEAGVSLPSDVKTTAAMIRSMFFISLHKTEIGNGYDEGVRLLCELTAAGFRFQEDK